MADETWNSKWPELDYNSWKDTYETLHRWTQIVGKIRLSNESWTNHSWHSTLYVTPRGLGTSAVPNGDRNFAIDFDFVNQRLVIQTSDAQEINLSLLNETCSSFYARVMDALGKLGISASFDPRPNELMDAIPFYEDQIHRTYNEEQAYNCWQVLVRINNVLKEFRSRFVGKCSPVHFFWGSFDLAVTRFSGRPAPEHPGIAPYLSPKVVKEAYSHEVSSAGFWPGNGMYPHAAFYSYAYPEPEGFPEAEVEPAAAFYDRNLKEFILPYEDVRTSLHPDETLLRFLQSTYEAAADFGHWDRDALEKNPFLDDCRKIQLKKKPTISAQPSMH